MKVMPIREFLRGGYREITEPTIVSRRGELLFTVMPHGYQAQRRREVVIELPPDVPAEKTR